MKPLIISGMLCMSAALLFFAKAPGHGSSLWIVVGGMLLLGAGTGVAYNPLFLSVMNGSPSQDSGVLSGIVNTSWTMGGTLGLTVVFGTSVVRAGSLMNSNFTDPSTRGIGYQACFLICAVTVAIAAAIASLFIQTEARELGRELT